MYHIAFCSCENYIKFVSVCITSIIKNLDFSSASYLQHPSNNLEQKKEKQEFVFHILSNTLSEKALEKLSALESELNCFLEQENHTSFFVRIQTHISSDEIFYGQPKWHGNYLAYYLLKLSSIKESVLEKTYDKKVLYLDGDILVNCDIRELFAHDMQDAACLMVPDKIRATYTLMPRNSEKGYTLSKDFTYYNSGVLLIDLPKWIDEYIEEKALAFLKKYVPRAPDQDVLNAIFREKENMVKPIPYKWNFMFDPSIKLEDRIFLDESKHFNTPFAKKEYLDAIENPKIIHYAKKPWNSRGLVITHKYDALFYPYHDLWWEMVQKTPVFREELENIRNNAAFQKKVAEEEKLADSFKNKPYSLPVLWFRLKRETRPFMRKLEEPFRKIRNKRRTRKILKNS